MMRVIREDITNLSVDAIVNPANSLGLMGGGVARAIKQKGGSVIEQQAVANAPIEVGDAITTTRGNLRCKIVIHAPTMMLPADLATKENVALATRAALRVALDHNIKSIAFPGMGTGVGALSKDVAAKIMIEELKDSNMDIFLVAFDEEMEKAFKSHIPQ